MLDCIEWCPDGAGRIETERMVWLASWGLLPSLFLMCGCLREAMGLGDTELCCVGQCMSGNQFRVSPDNLWGHSCHQG